MQWFQSPASDPTLNNVPSSGIDGSSSSWPSFRFLPNISSVFQQQESDSILPSLSFTQVRWFAVNVFPTISTRACWLFLLWSAWLLSSHQLEWAGYVYLWYLNRKLKNKNKHLGCPLIADLCIVFLFFWIFFFLFCLFFLKSVFVILNPRQFAKFYTLGNIFLVLGYGLAP